MKQYIIYFFLLLFYYNSNGQDLKIELFNKSGYDLDSVYFKRNYIGQIKKDSSILILNCEKMILEDNLPSFSPHGVIKNKKKCEPKSSEGIECGTRIRPEEINQGHYKFNINVIETNFCYRLYWKIPIQ